MQLAFAYMVIPTANATKHKEEHYNYLRAELSSLSIECKRKNELNDIEELEGLATTIKEVYFQDYKTAYASDSEANNSEIEIDKSHFDHLI